MYRLWQQLDWKSIALMASGVSGVMDDLDGLWVTTNGNKWKRMDVSKDSHSEPLYQCGTYFNDTGWQKDRGGLPAYVKCAIQARLVSFIGLTGLFTLGIGLCADTPPISICATLQLCNFRSHH